MKKKKSFLHWLNLELGLQTLHGKWQNLKFHLASKYFSFHTVLEPNSKFCVSDEPCLHIKKARISNWVVGNLLTGRICYAKGRIMDWWTVPLGCKDTANATHTHLQHRIQSLGVLSCTLGCHRWCLHIVCSLAVSSHFLAVNSGLWYSRRAIFDFSPLCVFKCVFNVLAGNSGLWDSRRATKQSRQDRRPSTTHTDLQKKDTEHVFVKIAKCICLIC